MRAIKKHLHEGSLASERRMPYRNVLVDILEYFAGLLLCKSFCVRCSRPSIRTHLPDRVGAPGYVDGNICSDCEES